MIEALEKETEMVTKVTETTVLIQILLEKTQEETIKMPEN